MCHVRLQPRFRVAHRKLVAPLVSLWEYLSSALPKTLMGFDLRGHLTLQCVHQFISTIHIVTPVWSTYTTMRPLPQPLPPSFFGLSMGAHLCTCA